MEAAPPIQYARTADGSRVAFSVIGQGPPILVLRTHTRSHLTLEWQAPILRATYRYLAQRATVIRLDFRGAGLSDRKITDLSVNSAVTDINAVLRRIAVERLAILCSGGFSGICGLYFAATCPDKVSALVCVDIGGGDSALSSAITDLRVIDLAVHARVRASVLARALGPENTGVISAIFQESTDADGHRAFVEMTRRTDIRPSLSRVGAPVLFMHTADNDLFPLGLAKELTTEIQNAVLHIRPDGSPIAILADDKELQVALDFLLGGSAGGRSGMLTATDEGRGALAKLSKREIDVLKLIVRGYTNAEIGSSLFISTSTVAHHLTNILAKTGWSNRTEAAAIASREGLG